MTANLGPAPIILFKFTVALVLINLWLVSLALDFNLKHDCQTEFLTEIARELLPNHLVMIYAACQLHNEETLPWVKKPTANATP